jgi:trigger factor
VEARLHTLASQGVDIKKLPLKWEDIRASQKDRAIREVKASLLVDKIAETEAIPVTNEEVDREVHRIARQDREPVAAVRKKLEENGTLARIAYRIRADKTVNFVFDHARKVAE